MIAKKATTTAPRERRSPQNGRPELVPYAYRQQKRRNTEAAQAQLGGIPKDQIQAHLPLPEPTYREPAIGEILAVGADVITAWPGGHGVFSGMEGGDEPGSAGPRCRTPGGWWPGSAREPPSTSAST